MILLFFQCCFFPSAQEQREADEREKGGYQKHKWRRNETKEGKEEKVFPVKGALSLAAFNAVEEATKRKELSFPRRAKL